MLQQLFNQWRLLDPHFGRAPAPVELDLGCGNGRFTLELAGRYPERLILGTDVKLGRLRRVEKRAERTDVRNLELLAVNSLDFVDYMLPDGCLDRAHLLCPDPWPKNRHQSRRLVTTSFLCRLAHVLKPGGILHMATDHLPYFDAWQQVLQGLPFYEPYPEGIADIADLRSDFELTWTALGKPVPHLAYRRRPNPHV